jgi:hypothetical protein
MKPFKQEILTLKKEFWALARNDPNVQLLKTIPE